MSEGTLHQHQEQAEVTRGFEQQQEGGLFLPKGFETDIHPAESSLDEARHIGTSESTGGSVRSSEPDFLTTSESRRAVTERRSAKRREDRNTASSAAQASEQQQGGGGARTVTTDSAASVGSSEWSAHRLTPEEIADAQEKLISIAESVAEDRFNGVASEESEAIKFLEFMGVVKAAFNTEDLHNRYIADLLDSTTEHVVAHGEKLRTAQLLEEARVAESARKKPTILGKTDLGHESGIEEASKKLRLESGEVYVEEHGEDRYINAPEDGIFAIFDGMGGKKGGAVAAEIIRDELLASNLGENKHNSPEVALASIKQALKRAQLKMKETADQSPDLSRMGSTAVVTQIVEHEGKASMVWAIVGDSRLYMGDQQTGPLQVGRDETLVQRALDNDQTPPIGKGHIVTNAVRANASGLDIKQSGIIDMSTLEGLRLMLCSDGITGDSPQQALSQQEMDDAFGRGDSQSSAQAFYEYSSKEDDKTVIVVDVQIEGGESNVSASPASTAVQATVNPVVTQHASTVADSPSAGPVLEAPDPSAIPPDLFSSMFETPGDGGSQTTTLG